MPLASVTVGVCIQGSLLTRNQCKAEALHYSASSVVRTGRLQSSYFATYRQSEPAEMCFSGTKEKNIAKFCSQHTYQQHDAV